MDSAVDASALDFSYKYPFTKEAKELVAKLNIQSIETDSLEAARIRLEDGLNKAKVSFTKTDYPELQRTYLISYAYSRMLVSALSSAYFVSRYAIAESKRIGEALMSDTDANMKRVGKELGINIKKEGDAYKVRFDEYLNSAPRSTDYALIHQKLENGIVSLTRSKVIRVLEEASKEFIIHGLPIDKKLLPKEIVAASRKVRVKMDNPADRIVNVKEEEYPPCIRKLLFDLKNRINLPHQARWTLAVYLLNVGVKPDDIKKLFITAPDYSERVTSYQVDFVAKNNYKMPSCATMRGYMLCVADCKCGTPLKYGRRGRKFQFDKNTGEIMEVKK